MQSVMHNSSIFVCEQMTLILCEQMSTYLGDTPSLLGRSAQVTPPLLRAGLAADAARMLPGCPQSGRLGRVVLASTLLGGRLLTVLPARQN